MKMGGVTKRVTCYLDIKSPHAYLAVRPTLELEKDYNCTVEFLPYALSYVSLGVTTSVDEDRKRKPASANATRKAKMYYTTAREYAKLQGLVIRGPHKLLDSYSAHKAMLFARDQGLTASFVKNVYNKGWVDGWRTYDMEDLGLLRASLEEVGADTADFNHFMQGSSQVEKDLEQIRERAEASGIVGVPHYEFFDEVSGKQLGLFGREHLALIRMKMHEEGLARTPDVDPSISHAYCKPVSAL